MSKEINGTATQRNYGIDALRIFSMFGIVVMHILYKGTLLTDTIGFKNMFLWFVEAIFYSSVNCFAMISGYVSCSKKEKSFGYRCEKYIKMWLGVLFWSVIINLAMMIFGNTEVKMKGDNPKFCVKS